MIDITNKNEIFEAICKILVKEFECDSDALKPESRLFEDLDLDSIDAVDLIVRLQKIINTKVKPEEFKQIQTLWDVTEVIYNIVNNKEQASD